MPRAAERDRVVRRGEVEILIRERDAIGGVAADGSREVDDVARIQRLRRHLGDVALGPIAVAVFFMNVVVRAWFACARMAPSGTLVATQTAPGAKAPLPTSSIAHASPSASTHEKLSPSLAYPCVATSRSMSAIASRHVRHRWRAISR